MEQLEGKVAVVTGAASGIGLAMARRFAGEKMKLVLLDIEEGPLAAAAEELRGRGTTVVALRADVSKGADLEAAAARAREELGTLHVLCNNAGVGGVGGPMWTLTEKDWEWTLSVNLWSVIHGIRVFLGPLLASGEEGHVVNTASMAGLTATPFMGSYTASKHAVVAISEVLAKDLELTGARVGVSVLCPGWVKTQISSSERNRPADLQTDTMAGIDPRVTEVVQQLVATGLDPDAVAEQVVRAIREKRFYILTHPEMKPAVQHRLRDILEERPPGIDPVFRQLGNPPAGTRPKT